MQQFTLDRAAWALAHARLADERDLNPREMTAEDLSDSAYDGPCLFALIAEAANHDALKGPEDVKLIVRDLDDEFLLAVSEPYEDNARGLLRQVATSALRGRDYLDRRARGHESTGRVIETLLDTVVNAQLLPALRALQAGEALQVAAGGRLTADAATYTATMHLGVRGHDDEDAAQRAWAIAEALVGAGTATSAHVERID